MCSSYTISGVMPGADIPARHGFEARINACFHAGYSGFWMHWKDYSALTDKGMSPAEFDDILARAPLPFRGVEFLTEWIGESKQTHAEQMALAACSAIKADVLNIGGDFLGQRIANADVRRRFESLCARAAQQGVSVAVEFVPFSSIPDVASALELIGEIENAGVVIDCWHVFRGNIPLPDLRQIPAESVLCVQVNDAAKELVGPLSADTLRRLPCGEGSFDLAEFIRTLDGMGVTTPLSVEIISPNIVSMSVEEAACHSLQTSRRVFG